MSLLEGKTVIEELGEFQPRIRKNMTYLKKEKWGLKTGRPNTVGARIPNAFGIWMVDRVRFNVRTIRIPNVLSLGRSKTEQNGGHFVQFSNGR